MKAFVSIATIGLSVAQKGRQTTEPVYLCPPQYTLIGKTCERQTIVPATNYCQQGTLQDNQCILPAQRDATCPPGTTPVNGGCTLSETIPAERFCPPNTHDIGGECQTYSVTGIVEVCQRGTLVGGQCEILESVAPTAARACPLGYQEQKGGCWKQVQMDCTPPNQGKRMLQGHGKGALYQAPATGKYHAPPATGKYHPEPVVPRYAPAAAKLSITSKQCEVKLEAPLYSTSQCPPGTERANNNCVTKSYEPATVECSLGQTYLCFPANTVPGNLRCPPGYQRNGDYCTKTNTVPKNTFCPPGTIEGPNGNCYTTAPPQIQCPPGTQLSGNVCLGKETVQPTVQVTVTCQGKNCFH